jgi:tagaturonate epimerase
VGDRFAHQAKAQLAACIQAAEAGVEVIPVWNKSNREHTIIGSEPASTRTAADAAVKALHWTKPYFCDADHVGLATVDRFFDACDFYTIDVADFIGKPADPAAVDTFVGAHPELLG